MLLAREHVEDHRFFVPLLAKRQAEISRGHFDISARAEGECKLYEIKTIPADGRFPLLPKQLPIRPLKRLANAGEYSLIAAERPCWLLESPFL